MIDQYTNQTGVLKRLTGRDVYGKATTAVGVDILMRFREGVTVSKDAKGDEIVTDAIVYVAPDIDINMDDVVEYEGKNYKVRQVHTKRDLSGTANHKKCFLVKIS